MPKSACPPLPDGPPAAAWDDNAGLCPLSPTNRRGATRSSVDSKRLAGSAREMLEAPLNVIPLPRHALPVADIMPRCDQCDMKTATVECRDCGGIFLCPACDSRIHKIGIWASHIRGECAPANPPLWRFEQRTVTANPLQAPRPATAGQPHPRGGGGAAFDRPPPDPAAPPAGDAVIGAMSPICPVTLGDEARRMAAIPSNAVSFAWAYPQHNAAAVWDDAPAPVMLFAEFGGFVYFAKSGKMVAANAVVGVGAMKEFGKSARKLVDALAFDPPLPWQEMRQTVCRRLASRWRPVTLPQLWKYGARHFTWVMPNEVSGCRHGGFAYIFRSPDANSDHCDIRDCFFPVADMLKAHHMKRCMGQGETRATLRQLLDGQVSKHNACCRSLSPRGLGGRLGKDAFVEHIREERAELGLRKGGGQRAGGGDGRPSPPARPVVVDEDRAVDNWADGRFPHRSPYHLPRPGSPQGVMEAYAPAPSPAALPQTTA